jgi:hypothetical protein
MPGALNELRSRDHEASESPLAADPRQVAHHFVPYSSDVSDEAFEMPLLQSSERVLHWGSNFVESTATCQEESAVLQDWGAFGIGMTAAM